MEIPADLLIDGYNLLHAAGFARNRYGRGDLERARLRLLGWLFARLSVAERNRTTVVFDAHVDPPPPDVPRFYRHEGMNIQFSNPGQDADTVIEAMIEECSSPTILTVVSGDARLQRAAKRCGAKSFTSEVFYEDLELRRLAPEKTPSVAAPPKRPVPPRETDRWLAEFADVSVPEIAKELETEEQGIQADPWLKHVEDLEKQLKAGQFDASAKRRRDP